MTAAPASISNDGEADVLALCEPEPVGESEGAAVAETVSVPEFELVMELDGDVVGEVDALCVREPDEDGETVAKGVCDGLPEKVLAAEDCAGVFVVVPDGEFVTTGDTETLPEALPVSDADGEELAVIEGEVEGEVVPDAEKELTPVAE